MTKPIHSIKISIPEEISFFSNPIKWLVYKISRLAHAVFSLFSAPAQHSPSLSNYLWSLLTPKEEEEGEIPPEAPPQNEDPPIAPSSRPTNEPSVKEPPLDPHLEELKLFLQQTAKNTATILYEETFSGKAQEVQQLSVQFSSWVTSVIEQIDPNFSSFSQLVRELTSLKILQGTALPKKLQSLVSLIKQNGSQSALIQKHQTKLPAPTLREQKAYRKATEKFFNFIANPGVETSRRFWNEIDEPLRKEIVNDVIKQFVATPTATFLSDFNEHLNCRLPQILHDSLQDNSLILANSCFERLREVLENPGLHFSNLYDQVIRLVNEQAKELAESRKRAQSLFNELDVCVKKLGNAPQSKKNYLNQLKSELSTRILSEIESELKPAEPQKSIAELKRLKQGLLAFQASPLKESLENTHSLHAAIENWLLELEKALDRSDRLSTFEQEASSLQPLPFMTQLALYNTFCKRNHLSNAHAPLSPPGASLLNILSKAKDAAAFSNASLSDLEEKELKSCMDALDTRQQEESNLLPELKKELTNRIVAGIEAYIPTLKDQKRTLKDQKSVENYLQLEEGLSTFLSSSLKGEAEEHLLECITESLATLSRSFSLDIRTNVFWQQKVRALSPLSWMTQLRLYAFLSDPQTALLLEKEGSAAERTLSLDFKDACGTGEVAFPQEPAEAANGFNEEEMTPEEWVRSSKNELVESIYLHEHPLEESYSARLNALAEELLALWLPEEELNKGDGFTKLIGKLRLPQEYKDLTERAIRDLPRSILQGYWNDETQNLFETALRSPAARKILEILMTFLTVQRIRPFVKNLFIQGLGALFQNFSDPKRLDDLMATSLLPQINSLLLPLLLKTLAYGIDLNKEFDLKKTPEELVQALEERIVEKAKQEFASSDEKRLRWGQEIEESAVRQALKKELSLFLRHLQEAGENLTKERCIALLKQDFFNNEVKEDEPSASPSLYSDLIENAAFRLGEFGEKTHYWVYPWLKSLVQKISLASVRRYRSDLSTLVQDATSLLHSLFPKEELRLLFQESMETLQKEKALLEADLSSSSQQSAAPNERLGALQKIGEKIEHILSQQRAKQAGHSPQEILDKSKRERDRAAKIAYELITRSVPRGTQWIASRTLGGNASHLDATIQRVFKRLLGHKKINEDLLFRIFEAAVHSLR